MNSITDKIFKYIYESPPAKTTFFFVSNIMTAIFGAILVVEILDNGIINWRLLHKAKSLYILFVITAFIYYYNRFVYLFETDVLKFKDREYCIAYMRSQCLPEIVGRYKSSVKNGRMDDLQDIHAEVEILIK